VGKLEENLFIRKLYARGKTANGRKKFKENSTELQLNMKKGGLQEKGVP